MILQFLNESNQLNEEVSGNGIEKIGNDVTVGDSTFTLYHITEQAALGQFELYNNDALSVEDKFELNQSNWDNYIADGRYSVYLWTKDDKVSAAFLLGENNLQIQTVNFRSGGEPHFTWPISIEYSVGIPDNLYYKYLTTSGGAPIPFMSLLPNVLPTENVDVTFGGYAEGTTLKSIIVELMSAEAINNIDENGFLNIKISNNITSIDGARIFDITNVMGVKLESITNKVRFIIPESVETIKSVCFNNLDSSLLDKIQICTSLENIPDGWLVPDAIKEHITLDYGVAEDELARRNQARAEAKDRANQEAADAFMQSIQGRKAGLDDINADDYVYDPSQYKIMDEVKQLYDALSDEVKAKVPFNVDEYLAQIKQKQDAAKQAYEASKQRRLSDENLLVWDNKFIVKIIGNKASIVGCKRVANGTQQETYSLPQDIDGKRLTRIEKNAFSGNNTGIKELYLPKSIEYIGPMAFYGSDITVFVPEQWQYSSAVGEKIKLGKLALDSREKLSPAYYTPNIYQYFRTRGYESSSTKRVYTY